MQNLLPLGSMELGCKSNLHGNLSDFFRWHANFQCDDDCYDTSWKPVQYVLVNFNLQMSNHQFSLPKVMQLSKVYQQVTAAEPKWRRRTRWWKTISRRNHRSHQPFCTCKKIKWKNMRRPLPHSDVDLSTCPNCRPLWKKPSQIRRWLCQSYEWQ